MEAVNAQEIVDSVCEWIGVKAGFVNPGEVICDGTQYSPSSRALPGLEDAWRDSDETWEYVDGKVDDYITDRGHYWDDGLLRKAGA